MTTRRYVCGFVLHPSSGSHSIEIIGELNRAKHEEAEGENCI